MTRQSATFESAPGEGRLADAFVIFAMTVLSLAVGAWLLSRVGLSLWVGMVAALGVYTVLLSLHLVVRRRFAQTAHPAPREDTLWLQTPPPPEADAPEADVAFRTHLAAVGRGEREVHGPAGDNAHFEIRPSRAAPKDTSGLAPARFRPGEPQFTLDEPQFADNEGTRAASPSEANVELIQDLIKQLADELNAKAPPEGDKAAPADDTEDMIGRSVAALETVASTMRAPNVEPAAKAPPIPSAAQPARWWPTVGARSAAGETGDGGPPALDPQLARIAEAVAADRMDVLLEPIRALAEGRTRHFEISVRLLTADGAALEQSDFAPIARGSGLMPRIDASRMIRAARVARRLSERGRQGSVLTTVGGESLTDEAFLDATAMQPGTDGRMRLVLSFAQSEVRTFTSGHAEALGSMAAAGFSFALEEVTDLDMDFSALRDMGFEFVKLDASVFLDGLPAASGRVPAADICRYLADHGLTLIVGRIDDEWLSARVLGFGVLLGKGALFGGPRQVKPEIVAEAVAA
jgi:cyclic-di-GMP phosphodiesterase TipF (flagellum assembly factor)